MKQDELKKIPNDSKGIALWCHKLKKYYGSVKAVDEVDLEVRFGECFGLLGPNGAGKTTLVEILEGLTRPDSGEVKILGYQWGTGDDRAFRERISVQLQETQLADKLTVEETIRLFRSFYQKGRSIEEVIILAGLEEKRKERVQKLSGGTKQRLALACALVSEPELLFLDEPTTGLDPQARSQVWDLINDFRRRGGTIILTTHYMEEASRLCDRVAIMAYGRILVMDRPSALVERYVGKAVIEFSVEDGWDENFLRQLPGVLGLDWNKGTYFLRVWEPGIILPILVSEVEKRKKKLNRLLSREANLEDVFMILTGGRFRDE